MENLQILINERHLFEIEIYDFLVNPFIGLPDSFWEPVKVQFKESNELEEIIVKDTCSICMEKKCNFKKVNCCRQKFCNDCCSTWFQESVKCPFCYQDIREFNLKKKDDISSNE